MKVNIFKKIDKKTAKAISVCIDTADLYGFEIYLVGGIVRDILLKKPLKDIDITVAGDATAFVKSICKNFKLKSVKYDEILPTAKVVFKNNIEIDFASTRQEVYDTPGNLPKIIKTGCELKNDVLRRDFTINTIALSLNKKNLFEIIDYTGGVIDLKKQKLKILHNQSFRDDPSRMIRCLKFAQRLGFKPDKETLYEQNKYLQNPYSNIPLERVKKEIKELFSLNKISAFNDFIKYGLYKIFVKETIEGLNAQMLRNALFEFCIREEDIWLLYFLPLFIKQDPPDKLNLTSRELKIIKDIKVGHQNNLTDNYSIYEFFKGKDYLSVVFYGIFYNLETAKRFFKIKDTKILTSGSDLIKLGIKQGKMFSEIQNAILKEKLNNNLKNKEEELKFLKKYLKNQTICTDFNTELI